MQKQISKVLITIDISINSSHSFSPDKLNKKESTKIIQTARNNIFIIPAIGFGNKNVGI